MDCEVRHARAQFIYPPIWGRGDRYISPGITEMNINRDIHKICIWPSSLMNNKYMSSKLTARSILGLTR